MSKLIIPENYKPALTLYRKQRAIEFIKNEFQDNLKKQLGLKRVSAPLVVFEDSGLNDNLSGVERPVTFDVPDIGRNGEIVHSLAKWKRAALKDYDFNIGNGLYTDMNAIRRDEQLDNLHSIYVDQWDWEKAIDKSDCNTKYLVDTVKGIVRAIYNTNIALVNKFPELKMEVEDELFHISTQELYDMYPDMSAKERENAICKQHHVVFLSEIGDVLSNGQKHDNRAPDYDNWHLNGDILYYDEVLDCALEISSMGIRVDKETMLVQLEKAQAMERAQLPFHQRLLNDELPQSIGGGIGQSRLCMLLMGCAHIGEVQASLWDQETLEACKEAGINIL